MVVAVVLQQEKVTTITDLTIRGLTCTHTAGVWGFLACRRSWTGAASS